MLKDVKNGELVIESQMKSFEEASRNGETSKERDIEATSRPAPTSNALTT